MHEKRVTRAYHRELFGAIALYTVLLMAAIRYGRPMDDGVLRTLVLASPMIGFGVMIWAIARHLARVDEFIRKQLMENVALAAAITAGLTFTYGFLETASYPKLSMFTVWCVLCGTFGVVQIVRKLASK
ncbi:hypothetical protein [Massilia brevitalea]|uniref:hypothetical protein n=1 Tax=Massilia brevitalea TaxID=442526 RepID=UPI00273983DF|nr:hypothetical protein [Massilia brevitalea]